MAAKGHTAPEVERVYVRHESCASRWGTPLRCPRCCGGCGIGMYRGRSSRPRASWGSSSSASPRACTAPGSSCWLTARWNRHRFDWGSASCRAATWRMEWRCNPPAPPRPGLSLRPGPVGGLWGLCRLGIVVAGLSGPSPGDEPCGAHPSPGSDASPQPGVHPECRRTFSSVPSRGTGSPDTGQGGHDPLDRAEISAMLGRGYGLPGGHAGPAGKECRGDHFRYAGVCRLVSHGKSLGRIQCAVGRRCMGRSAKPKKGGAWWGTH